jgi:hypothetical protein
MHKQQHLPIHLTLIFVIFVGAYMTYEFGARTQSMTTPTALQAESSLRAQPAVTNISRHVHTLYAQSAVDYPQFSGELAALNGPIEKLIMEGIRAHDKASEENWKARLQYADPKGSIPEVPAANDRFPYHASWSLTQFDSDRVSGLIDYDDFSGGAHGSAAIAVFNYDMKTHRPMMLADLFPNDKDYLQKVSKAAISALVDDRKNATGQATISDYELKWINEGAAPKVENFQNFTTHGNRLTLYFGQYQVGPYAIGMPQIELWLPLQ